MQQNSTLTLRILLTIGMTALAVYLLVPTAIYFTLDDKASDEVRQDSSKFNFLTTFITQRMGR